MRTKAHAKTPLTWTSMTSNQEGGAAQNVQHVLTRPSRLLHSLLTCSTLTNFFEFLPCSEPLFVPQSMLLWYVSGWGVCVCVYVNAEFRGWQNMYMFFHPYFWLSHRWQDIACMHFSLHASTTKTCARAGIRNTEYSDITSLARSRKWQIIVFV